MHPTGLVNATRVVTSLSLVFVFADSCFCQANIRRISGTGQAHGSVAVAVVRQDTIAVSAESRTSTDGVVNPDTTCKMTIVHDIVFASTGLLWGRREQMGIVDYARSVLEGPGAREAKFQTFQEGTSRMLTAWLNQQPFRDSLRLSLDFRYRRSIQAMFCFFLGKKPIIVKYTFVPSWTGTQFKVSGIYDAGKRKPGEIIWMGLMEQTDSLLSKDSVFSKRVQRCGGLSAGQVLIEKQMEFTPRYVGGPIDIAVVTPSGAAWIRKKQNCE